MFLRAFITVVFLSAAFYFGQLAAKKGFWVDAEVSKWTAPVADSGQRWLTTAGSRFGQEFTHRMEKWSLGNYFKSSGSKQRTADSSKVDGDEEGLSPSDKEALRDLLK